MNWLSDEEHHLPSDTPSLPDDVEPGFFGVIQPDVEHLFALATRRLETRDVGVQGLSCDRERCVGVENGYALLQVGFRARPRDR